MTTEEEKLRAYTLVVELLAHQLAFPVQWIKIQDTLLREKSINTAIEIGPSATLTDLLKKTIESKYRDHDAVLSVQRQLLSSANDTDKIYHIHQEERGDAEHQNVFLPEEKDSGPSDPASTIKAPPLPEELPVEQEQIATTVDVCVQVEDILATILASKLKKKVEDIPMSSDIKTLVAGRSTLQNEIVGDLLKEFGTIPERSEERPLHELAATLNSATGNHLGKHTIMLLQRTLSATMPGDFTEGKARRYIQEKWHLGPGRQDAIFLSMILSPATARLQSAAEVHTYLDSRVKIYAKRCGLQLERKSEHARPTIEANPEFLQDLRRDQDTLARQKLHAYAEFLKIDLDAASNETQALGKTVSALQRQLDQWLTEHGDAYMTGTAQSFQREKVRKYSSYWNWALQDLYRVFQASCQGQLDWESEQTREIVCRLANRSNMKLVESVRYLLSQSTQDTPECLTLEEILAATTSALEQGPVFRNFRCSTTCQTIIDEAGNITVSECKRDERSQGNDSDHIQIKRKVGNDWHHDVEFSQLYQRGLDQISSIGISFQAMTVLLTGTGRNSIGSEILKGLLGGGAKVIVTTSSFSTATTRIYQEIYATWGSKGSQLVLLPFNQGSVQDTQALVEYIYDTKDGGLGWDIDAIIPFAAISVADREIDDLDSKSELAFRIMLTNVLRLIGTCVKLKKKVGNRGRPTHVILPLSPNKGVFGGDGLYAESKVALECLFDKWHSESWKDYISVCGASIGWVRGTGLMEHNDILAEGIEKKGVRTYSPDEMACRILALLNRRFTEVCQTMPLLADMSGGLNLVPELQNTLSNIREDLNALSAVRKAVYEDLKNDMFIVQAGSETACQDSQPSFTRRANLQIGFPRLLDYATEIAPLNPDLRGMVDLETTVVVAGFAELGPCGNSRTRWEMEIQDELSLAGCIEMAWIMGLIKFSRSSRSTSPSWIDTKTNERIDECDIKPRFEKHILEHSGIRLIEPTVFDDYDPHKKRAMQDIVIQQDLAPFEASKESALSFQREHGDKAAISAIVGSENYNVTLKKGAMISVPKSVRFGNDIGGQLPQGWNPRTYGISEDLINQVDPTTLYSLVATVEALFSAGITDPYEIYQYIHVSELGNCIGTGGGGTSAMKKMYRQRFLEQPIQNDILQETFLNIIGGWVNMLLLSSAGPIKTPVGACATSVESLDTAYDLITGGKAKMCFIGATDDLAEDTSFEFANMKATCDADAQREAGRSPKEMSRPAAASRGGFLESHGSGIQVVSSAKLALDMGLPIYGIVAFTSTSSDKASRSVPMPGKGVLVNAREAPSKFPSPLLDLRYRRRQVDIRRKQIAEFKEIELSRLEETRAHMKDQDNDDVNAEEYYRHMENHINMEAEVEERSLLKTFGNHFWKQNPEISPIKGALATWGLGIDDINIASFHGTSTVKNELNECSIVQEQMSHQGRTKGNRLLGVFQKSLTGHPKGPAGAWMLNGCMQILDTGLVPGNRNLDNLDDSFQDFDFITFPNRTLATTGINAFSLTSFGFGQKGAQVIGVHSKYLFATLSRDQYEEYRGRAKRRQAIATARFNKGLVENNLVTVKETPPYSTSQEVPLLLNPHIFSHDQ